MNMKEQDVLFNSLTDPVPGLRGDIDIIEVEHKERPVLYFHDTLQYLPSDFALDQQVAGLLSLIDGRRSIREMSGLIQQNGGQISEQDLLEFIKLLDQHNVLYSPSFKTFTNELEQSFEEQDVRPPSCTGSSYPTDPEELRIFLDRGFKSISNTQDKKSGSVKALYAPHIDLRIGMQSYAKSFTRLSHLKPKRVVILATSHYAGLFPEVYDGKPFIASEKTFRLPSGDIPADAIVLNELKSRQDEMGISFKDRAHRIEHSIELHLILLQYVWNHDFEIVPLLVGNIDEMFYTPDGAMAGKIEALGQFLFNRFNDDEETLILISGDLAHIGEKFGDSTPARAMLQNVKSFDDQFLKYAANADKKNLLGHVAKEYDPYRICGFPPLYTFLSAFNDLNGTTLTYDVWDEHERNSAVTFGSVLYKK